MVRSQIILGSVLCYIWLEGIDTKVNRYSKALPTCWNSFFLHLLHSSLNGPLHVPGRFQHTVASGSSPLLEIVFPLNTRGSLPHFIQVAVQVTHSQVAAQVTHSQVAAQDTYLTMLLK